MISLTSYTVEPCSVTSQPYQIKLNYVYWYYFNTIIEAQGDGYYAGLYPSYPQEFYNNQPGPGDSFLTNGTASLDIPPITHQGRNEITQSQYVIFDSIQRSLLALLITE